MQDRLFSSTLQRRHRWLTGSLQLNLQTLLCARGRSADWYLKATSTALQMLGAFSFSVILY